MAPRGEGRFCDRCQHTVVDLSQMSRAQAESRMRRAAGDSLCVQLAVDEHDRPRFVPPPSRAPRWAGGLVLVSALTAGGCASTEPEAAAEILEPCDLEPGDLGPPMIPTASTEPPPATAPADTHPVPADASVDDLSASERAALEADKHRAQHPIRHVRGRIRMPSRR